MKKMNSQRGNTLIGELIALAIMGTAVMVLISGLGTTSASVGVIEQRVSGENLARQQLELIKESPYYPNPTAAPYPSVAIGCPPGAAEGCTPIYSAEVIVGYWDAETETFSETLPADDPGLQRVQVVIRSSMMSNDIVYQLEDYKVNR